MFSSLIKGAVVGACISGLLFKASVIWVVAWAFFGAVLFALRFSKSS